MSISLQNNSQSIQNISSSISNISPSIHRYFISVYRYSSLPFALRLSPFSVILTLFMVIPPLFTLFPSLITVFPPISTLVLPQFIEILPPVHHFVILVVPFHSDSLLQTCFSNLLDNVFYLFSRTDSFLSSPLFPLENCFPILSISLCQVLIFILTITRSRLFSLPSIYPVSTRILPHYESYLFIMSP